MEAVSSAAQFQIFRQNRTPQFLIPNSSFLIQTKGVLSMNLSRKWLSEFVTVDANDKEFAEAMTLSGSKVELTHDLGM